MSESHEREQGIFSEALPLPAGERQHFLDGACADDAALRARVEALLRAHEAAGQFMDIPVAPATDGLEPPAPPTPSREEVSGLRIGRYKLLQKIGEGGCGAVWMAEQEAPVRRTVALKIIKLGMDTSEVIARFEAERQALAMLDHPNIAKILDAGATETGRPYFVMELVRGIRITDFCDRYNLSTAQRLELFAQACHAVQHAHQKGIIHRDLKPSNILVTLNDGVPMAKVIDFGIAKATTGRLTDRTLFTAFEQFIGTPSYMSPEQAELSGIDIDTRSDVYSLGVLLYELLSGRLPFDPKSLLRAGLDEIRRIIREVEPPRPSTNLLTLEAGDRDQVARQRSTDAARLSLLLRGDLDWIVMRCLEKNRARRYETPDALAADIARHLRNEPVIARPASRLYRLNRLIRRNRLVFAAGSAIVLALVAGVALSTWQAIRATRAERAARVERATAVAERTRAESLLKFMLGDLYTQLDKVGKLELLDAVADKANGYFASLQPTDLDDTTQFSRARALRLLAAVRLNQGRTAEASRAVAEGYARASDLVARHPSDGEALFERGQDEFVAGSISYQNNEFPATAIWMTRYRDTAQELVALDPARREWQSELADGDFNLATLQEARGDLAAARLAFIDEVAALEKWVALDPGDPALIKRLAEARESLGNIADLQGKFSEAFDQYSREADGFGGLARGSSATAQFRFGWAYALMNLMTVEMVTGRYPAARESLARAENELDALIAIDGQNVTWLKLALIGRVAEVTLDLQRHDSASARIVLERVFPELEVLTRKAPADRTLKKLLARGWRQMARMQSEAANGGAEASVARSVEFGDWLTVSPDASEAEISECAEDHRFAGELDAQAEDRDAAVREWTRAAELLKSRVGHTQNWRILDPAARVAADLGRTEEARSLVEHLTLLGYLPIEPWPDLGRSAPAKAPDRGQK